MNLLRFAFCWAVLLVAELLIAGPALAQVETEPPAAPRFPEPSRIQLATPYGPLATTPRLQDSSLVIWGEQNGFVQSPNAVGFTYYQPSREEQELQGQVRELVAKIKENDDSSKEAELRTELKSLLEKVFDARLTPREKQIKALEEQLAELRNSIDERKQRKDEIVELKLKSLVNQAKGLGF